MMNNIEQMAEEAATKAMERLPISDSKYACACEAAREMAKRMGHAIPESFVLVPKEPTEAMLVAGWGKFKGEDTCMIEIYKAMLTANSDSKDGEGV